mmetsp:Transcript_16588/g.42740  ORF Transcript_16588/g.42740 Transcript_16588/m.42740 type:complete len:306 (+) Transcript_16588:527-1444(+)
MRSTRKWAAWPCGKYMRLTANPAQLPTTTGVFLMFFARPRSACRTSGAVDSVRMISSRGILCAGEKKCAPTTRPWLLARGHLTATRSMLMEDVFVARMQLSETMASSSANRSCLTLTFSTAASMTISQSAKPDSSVTKRARAGSSTAAAAFPRFLRTRSRAASDAASLISRTTTAVPGAARTAAAMPAPMSPPPMMPTRRSGRGFPPCTAASRAGSRPAARCAKKEWMRALDASPVTSWKKAVRSASRPAGRTPCVAPTWMTRTASAYWCSAPPLESFGTMVCMAWWQISATTGGGGILAASEER